MKQHYLAILAILSLSAGSQTLTLTNHAPQPGDVVTTRSCDSTGVLPGNSGTGVVWDFSGVTLRNTLHQVTAGTCANPDYPMANTCLTSGSGTVSYVTASASGLSYYGGEILVSHWTATLKYTSPAGFAKYPLSYNTSTTSVTGGSINIIGFDGTFSGTCQTSADGTGTLVLPGSGASYPAMRVTTSQTVDFSAHTAPGRFIRTMSDYYTPGIKAPLFSIAVTSSTISGGVPPIDTRSMVTIYKDYLSAPSLGLNQQTVINGISVYPNPASSHFFVSTVTPGRKQASLYSLTGDLLCTYEFGLETEVNIGGYDNGLYFYRITDEDNTLLKSGKVVVAR